MCGIFGVINQKDTVNLDKVLGARDILKHRGPDDEGFYLGNNNKVAFAHRRLSILDLSPSGHQPMISENGRFIIIYNGEIYNYHELRELLLKDGQKFISTSDTEVILYLYKFYMNKCVDFLRGMFAFAIWDDKEKTFFAARDRFGIKPFYYYKTDTEFVFSSELKAIKYYKKNLTLNNYAIDAFLRTGSVPAPMTIYNEVAALLPGHYLEIRTDSSDFDSAQRGTIRMTIEKYWEFKDLLADGEWLMDDGKKVLDSYFHGNERGNVSQSLRGATHLTARQERRSNLKYNGEAKKKIREALLDTIKAHLVADVEVGAFLSGGIDSTAVVSLMRQVGKEKIKTVSIVFPGNKLDESKYSRLAAKTYKTEHIEVPIYEKDLIDDFENIMSVMDQPTIDGINTYFVSKAAKQAGLKVVLSGLGGDELFGGYPSFNLIPKFQRIKNIPFAKMFMKAAALLLKNKLPAKAIEYMKNPDEPNAEYKLMRGLFTDKELKALGWKDKRAKNKVKSENAATNDTMITNGNFISDVIAYEVKQSLSTLQYVSMMETTYYMRNQLLRDSDVFSMAHSIELRVPFVDHKLYEAVLPYLDDAYDKNFPKKMLVEAVGDIPTELVNRPKVGFTFPFEDWIMKGQLKDLIIEKIKNLNNNFNLYPFVPEMNPGQAFDLEELHWSRLWALFILSKYG